jgi:hypothetical protein
MAGVGTGTQVGITIWVVADGRYEPQNFPFFHIDDSELVWDFSKNLSNYTTLRVQKEAALNGAGWEMESSITVNETIITNVILSGGQYTGGLYGGGAAYAGPADPTLDYLAVGDPDAGADGGPSQTADQVRTADIAALFVGLTGPSVRVTRIRSDIAHAAMTKDFLIQASMDQSEVSNVRNVTKSVNLVCPLYNGCNVVGMGTPAQAALSVAGGTTSAGGGGCAAAVRSTRAQAGLGALAGLAGLAGLVVARAVRSRRRRG